jgi:hypothetical protein
MNKKSIVIKIDIHETECEKNLKNVKFLQPINNDICKILKNTKCIKPVFLQYKIFM